MSIHSGLPYPSNTESVYDVIVVGGGMAGMATAARLQAQGLRTLVCEAHSKAGGCAGYFRRQDFAFDVGATTLVDFEPGGVGYELLNAIGMADIPERVEALPGYVAWLPDRCVTLYRDKVAWAAERLRAFGDSVDHRRFWALLDHLAAVFWQASRNGVKLPLQSPMDVLYNLRALGIENLLLTRYLLWTMDDALRAFNLRGDKALSGLFAMLIEDTVHGTLDRAPLLNSVLGITIRGAGLTRWAGGMRGFWTNFTQRYQSLGGELRLKHRVKSIIGRQGAFQVEAIRADGSTLILKARQVVSALPTALTEAIAPQLISGRIRHYLERDSGQLGGAIVVFIGVPEAEIDGQSFTHHQLLQRYDAPLGNGNNMFISVSAAEDTLSAPAGYRSVMISTHCELTDWEGLSEADYAKQRSHSGQQLLNYARRVYPGLGECARVFEVGTPQTYAHFTGRPRGAVGGVRQTRWNSNQFAVPHNLGIPGFWLVGDSTFPGLGTVACVLGSRLVAQGVLNAHA